MNLLEMMLIHGDLFIYLYFYLFIYLTTCNDDAIFFFVLCFASSAHPETEHHQHLPHIQQAQRHQQQHRQSPDMMHPHAQPVHCSSHRGHVPSSPASFIHPAVNNYCMPKQGDTSMCILLCLCVCAFDLCLFVFVLFVCVCLCACLYVFGVRVYLCERH